MTIKKRIISVNKSALTRVRQLLEKADELNVEVISLKNGCTVVDAGINVEGSLEAGRLISEICMGGVSKVELLPVSYGSEVYLSVYVKTDHPIEACLASQMAGWMIKAGGISAFGSGPARALSRIEKDLYSKIAYEDNHNEGVLFLEGRKIPTAETADYVSGKCNISPENLYIIVAPTASLVGSIQIASRVLEASIYPLYALGYDVTRICSGVGICPMPPVVKNDVTAMFVTNDAIIFAGKTFLYTRDEKKELEKMLKKLYKRKSEYANKSFKNIMEEFNGKLQDVDPAFFLPAEVLVNDVNSGQVYTGGKVDFKKFIGVIRTYIKSGV
ncbi:MAG: methenyltetrahydromethanopterin cyclohydrolase [Candidatus Odinarchaeia archaeon]